MLVTACFRLGQGYCPQRGEAGVQLVEAAGHARTGLRSRNCLRESERESFLSLCFNFSVPPLLPPKFPLLICF